LRTAAKLGIKRYRTDWWSYDLKKPIWPQVEALRPVAKELAALNRAVGITGLYQNHAGYQRVGASGVGHFRGDQGLRPEGPRPGVRHPARDGRGRFVVATMFQLVKGHIGRRISRISPGTMGS